MNDKLYSKKTLRAAISDLEKQVALLQDRITDANAELIAVRSVNAYLKTTIGEMRQEQDNYNATVKANASIVSNEVLHNFQEWRRQNHPDDVIPMIKALRTLTKDATGEMCSLREARDFVWFITGRDVSRL